MKTERLPIRCSRCKTPIITYCIVPVVAGTETWCRTRWSAKWSAECVRWVEYLSLLCQCRWSSQTSVASTTRVSGRTSEKRRRYFQSLQSLSSSSTPSSFHGSRRSVVNCSSSNVNGNYCENTVVRRSSVLRKPKQLKFCLLMYHLVLCLRVTCSGGIMLSPCPVVPLAHCPSVCPVPTWARPGGRAAHYI